MSYYTLLKIIKTNLNIQASTTNIVLKTRQKDEQSIHPYLANWIGDRITQIESTTQPISIICFHVGLSHMVG